MPKADPEEIRRAIIARAARVLPEDSRAAERQSLAEKASAANAKTIQSAFAVSGVNLDELRTSLRQNQRAYREASRRLQPAHAGDAANRKAAFEAREKRRRAILKQIGVEPFRPGPPTFVVLPEPLFIGQIPQTAEKMLVDWSIAPYDSRAKVLIDTNISQAGVSFEFWYNWYNDRDNFTIVTAVALPTLNGSIDVLCDSGGFGGNAARLTASTNLVVYDQGGIEELGAVGEPLASIDLVGGFFSGASEYQPVVYTTFDQVLQNVLVAPHQGVLIDVGAYFWWSFEDSNGAKNDGDSDNNIRCDFANDEADYFVQCPFVLLEIANLILL